jgi:hypothetical protein
MGRIWSSILVRRATLGANDRAQSGFGFRQFPVDQNIVVIFVPADLFGRFPDPPRNHIFAIFAPRAEAFAPEPGAK